MWAGVTKGLAGRKLSGSIRRLGHRRQNRITQIKRTTNPTISLTE